MDLEIRRLLGRLRRAQRERHGGDRERERRRGRERGCDPASSDDDVSRADERDGAVRPDGGTTSPSTNSSPSPSPDTDTTSSDSRLSKLRHSDAVQALPFWLPPALLMGWFVYGAVGWNLLISLTDWSGLEQPEYTDLSLDNYREFFANVWAANENLFMTGPTEFWVVRNTIILLVVFTVASLLIGLVLAILVDQNIRFENTFRTIYLLPMALSFVVTAIFWSWMYNPTTGTINVVLSAIVPGSVTWDWLGNPRTRLWAIIFALTWQFSGYAMVVYLAGLRAIPDAHYEAAKVDGASTLRMYWRVIVPQLSASTTSAAVVLMVFALKAFDFIFVMFGDNPGRAADILAVMMFREAFSRTNWAYGATVATILFLMALSVVAPYLYTQYRRGDL